MPRKKSRAGTAVRPNIQRQPVVPYQEPRMKASLDPAGRPRTSHQLTNWASRMPMTMVSWLTATRRPRMAGRGDLGDVHRREVGGQADGRAAQDAPEDEQREGGRQPVADRGADEDQGRGHQQPLAAEAVAEGAGGHGPDQAADQGAAVGPASGRGAGQLEEALEERLGPPDHDPVVSEQEPAHGGGDRDHPDEAQAKAGAFDRGEGWAAAWSCHGRIYLSTREGKSNQAGGCINPGNE